MNVPDETEMSAECAPGPTFAVASTSRFGVCAVSVSTIGVPRSTVSWSRGERYTAWTVDATQREAARHERRSYLLGGTNAP